jgi:type II secretory pathway pseudopilin PulG
MKDQRRFLAMTLIEVIIAMLVFGLLLGGILDLQIQSRRITEGGLYQNAALTVVQGYLEQLKKIDLPTLLNSTSKDSVGNILPYTAGAYAIPLIRGNPAGSGATSDPFVVTPLTLLQSPPALSTITPGTTQTFVPAVYDNLRNFDMAKDLTATNVNSTDTTATTGQLLWTTAWPNAINYPPYTNTPYIGNNNVSANCGATDLKLNMWIWIQNLTGASANTANVYGIIIIYTYQYYDGHQIHYFMGTIRTMRSSVS